MDEQETVPLDEHIDIIREAYHLKKERDDARFVARALWDFIQEGCFLDDIEMGEPDTPEWELWIKQHVVQDVVSQNPWLKEGNND